MAFASYIDAQISAVGKQAFMTSSDSKSILFHLPEFLDLASFATCDDSLLAKCGQDFATAIGISAGTSGRDFVDYVYKLVANKGVDGIKETCAYVLIFFTIIHVHSRNNLE